MPTIVDCILAAAASLSLRASSFSAEDLVVRAWELYPNRFGLQGYADRYPDSNRILTKVMGASGRLRRDGLLERIGTKRYRLTSKGQLAAAAIQGSKRGAKSRCGASGDSSERLAGVKREISTVLRRLLSSQALAKFGSRQPLSFSDVAGMLNISARSTANQLNARWGEALAAVTSAREALGAGPGHLPGTATDVSADQLDLLEGLLEHVSVAFAEDLAVIRSRSDERYS